MNIDLLSSPLPIDQVEFRVQSITSRGKATILAYKSARADMQRLDESVGALNWKREHVNDNKNCIVSIWNNDTKQWISKEDTGTESNTEKEKGLASDSFKRACFNWGIGRELYDYPIIKIDLIGGQNNKWDNEWENVGQKAKQAWGLKLKEWKWTSKFTDGKITFLQAVDQRNNVRFSYGTIALDLIDENQIAALRTIFHAGMREDQFLKQWNIESMECIQKDSYDNISNWIIKSK